MLIGCAIAQGKVPRVGGLAAGFAQLRQVSRELRVNEKLHAKIGSMRFI